MDTKKLRQKILDLAIRGKLVPQDPNDEPASVLLERIKAEKQQLIKEGKIKASKASKTSDTSHYENVPFEVPKGWVWTTIGELLCNRDEERIPVSSAIRKKQTNKIYDYYGAAGVIDKVDSFLFNERLLLIGEDGANLLSRAKDNAFFAEGKYWVNNHAHILDCTDKKMLDYVAFVINAMDLSPYISGSAQPKLNQENLNKILIPLPPKCEQERIICTVSDLEHIVQELSDSTRIMNCLIDEAKAKILTLAISGKLVPQDPSDEPAIELLRRLNPSFKPCDNSHYENLPSGWVACRLEQILEYEQPQPYIVESTDYSDKYETPVLTPGKSFILGYTNETSGVYIGPFPVIIFDDFTTASRLVDFPFKVKSSAMKILHPAPEIDIQYVQYFMSITRLVGDTHKRYWISEYSKLIIPIPPLQEQKRIISVVESLMSKLDGVKDECFL